MHALTALSKTNHKINFICVFMFFILWNNKIFVFIMDHLNSSIKARTAKMGECVYWMAYIFLNSTTATSILLIRLKSNLLLKSNY